MQDFGVSYEQLKWRRWCINNNCNGDVEQFHQEYPSTPEEAFIASGRPRFNIGVLKQYRRQAKEGDIGKLEYSGNRVVFSPDLMEMLRYGNTQKRVNITVLVLTLQKGL